MAGLYASAGAFFSYYLLVTGTLLFTSSIFRLFGALCSMVVSAQRERREGGQTEENRLKAE
jgi:hypothetical protein